MLHLTLWGMLASASGLRAGKNVAQEIYFGFRFGMSRAIHLIGGVPILFLILEQVTLPYALVVLVVNSRCADAYFWIGTHIFFVCP